MEPDASTNPLPGPASPPVTPSISADTDRRKPRRAAAALRRRNATVAQAVAPGHPPDPMTADTAMPQTASATPRMATVEGGILPLGLAASNAATLIGISESLFYQMKKTGRLPRPIRLGRRVLWLRAELEAWMAAGAPSQSRWEAIKADRSPKR